MNDNMLHVIFGAGPLGLAVLDELIAQGLPARVVTGDQVVVLGAEGRGLRAGILRVIDHRIRIPMGGRPSKEKIKMEMTITESRKAVPHR